MSVGKKFIKKRFNALTSLRSKGIAYNASGLKEVADLNHNIMNEAIQFDNRYSLLEAAHSAISFKPFVICSRFPRPQYEAQKKENKNF